MIRKLQDAILRVAQCRAMNNYPGGVEVKEEQCGGVPTKELDTVLEAASMMSQGQGSRLGSLYAARHFTGRWGIRASIGTGGWWFSFPVTSPDNATEDAAWKEFESMHK